MNVGCLHGRLIYMVTHSRLAWSVVKSTLVFLQGNIDYKTAFKQQKVANPTITLTL